MAWSFVQKVSVTNNGNVGPTSAALPGGLTTNHLIVIGARVFNTGITLATPTSGATAYTILNSTYVYDRVYGRFASGSSEPAPTLSGNGNFTVDWAGIQPPPSKDIRLVE